MTKEIKDQSKNPTQSLTIKLPCLIVERIERYAKENGTDIAGVLIEGLDSFLERADMGTDNPCLRQMPYPTLPFYYFTAINELKVGTWTNNPNAVGPFFSLPGQIVTNSTRF